MSAAADLGELELVLAVEQARELGFRVMRLAEPRQSELGRNRCWVGRKLSDRVFYVVLYGGQSAEEALAALQAALDMLMRFDEELWFVHVDEPVPVASTLLSDVHISTWAGR